VELGLQALKHRLEAKQDEEKQIEQFRWQKIAKRAL